MRDIDLYHRLFLREQMAGTASQYIKGEKLDGKWNGPVQVYLPREDGGYIASECDYVNGEKHGFESETICTKSFVSLTWRRWHRNILNGLENLQIWDSNGNYLMQKITHYRYGIKAGVEKEIRISGNNECLIHNFWCNGEYRRSQIVSTNKVK